MQNTILIFNASPRKEGNSSYLTGKILEGIREKNPDASLEVINLHSMKIEPCRGCNACRAENKKQPYCIIKDDMQDLYEKIVQSKAIVLVSPIYMFTVAAQMKLFMDRINGLAAEITLSLKDKPVGILLVYGDVDPYISGAINAIRTLQDFFRFWQSKILGIVYGSANDIGDAEKNRDLCENAYNLGRMLG
ncbi:MAG: flavodoxin family protein [Dehalobacterium sp.]